MEQTEYGFKQIKERHVSECVPIQNVKARSESEMHESPTGLLFTLVIQIFVSFQK